MKRIPLEGKRGAGKYALVDNEDYAELSKYKWYLNDNGYAAKSQKQPTRYMHKLVFGHQTLPHIDHINRNKLDNRKSNLRECTISENMANQSIRSDNKSGYKGISWDSKKNKWFACTRKNKKTIYIGRYKNINDAIREHEKVFLEIHGVKP